ncbi:MAG: hypothetical protein ACF8PN_09320 [Phycisphaerales bacterium]
MRQLSKGILTVGALAGFAIAQTSQAQVSPPWSEDFDSYANGTAISTVGGWSNWDNDPLWESFVSNSQANSGANSLDIVGNSDTVMVFEDVECGTWTFTTQQFVPNGFSGESYFILLNQYSHGGDKSWSTQVRFNSATGQVEADFSGEVLPLVTGQWVELRVEIDLDNDTQEFYYGGDLLYTGPWVGQVSGTGQLELEALDLFANGASSVYYDDISLTGTPCPPQDLDLSASATFLAGQNATFDVSGATSGETVVILYGTSELGTPRNAQSGNFCVQVGISINFQSPTDNLVCTGPANASGDFSCTVRVPNQGAGRTIYFQAFQSGTCPDPSFSNVISRTIL